MSQPHDMAAPLLAGAGLRIVLVVVMVGVAASAVVLLRAYCK
ncbi:MULTISPECIES: hypothetical protein [unclassified Streptomyces]|nr:hypothetical protein [Streptomyces sp. CoH27]